MLDIKMSSKIVMQGVNVKYKDEFRHLCISYDFNGNLRNINGKNRLDYIANSLFGISQECLRQLVKLRDRALEHAKELMSTIEIIDAEHVNVKYENYIMSMLIDDGFISFDKVLNTENDNIISRDNSLNKFCENLDSKYVRELEAIIKYLIYE